MFEDYLRMKGLSIVSFSKQTGIPISTLRNLNKIRYDKWKIRYLEVLSNVLNKNILEIIEELKNMGKNLKSLCQKQKMIIKFGNLFLHGKIK